MQKTKSHGYWKDQRSFEYFHLRGKSREENYLNYLGDQFAEDRDTFEQIKNRINNGYASPGKLSKIWKVRNISRQLKLRCCQQQKRRRLQAFEINCLSRILGNRRD